MQKQIMLYGANGYTGKRILNALRAINIHPILAGRNKGEIEKLAEHHQLQFRIFTLDDAEVLKQQLTGVHLCINAAGPFSNTALAMCQACIGTYTHYLDITGEVSVFEAVAALDAEAKHAGVMLMPGSGFDIAVSDCLAVHLKKQLPSGSHLKLGLRGVNDLSHGTTVTMIEGMAKGSARRRNGKLESVPLAGERMVFTFKTVGRKKCSHIPWGDVSTAWYSAEIPNIDVYSNVPWYVHYNMKLIGMMRAFFSKNSVQRFLISRVKAGGPDEDADSKKVAGVCGILYDKDGNSIQGEVESPSGYTFTAKCVALSSQYILAGKVKPGFRTPAMAFGEDFICQIGGVTFYF